MAFPDGYAGFSRNTYLQHMLCWFSSCAFFPLSSASWPDDIQTYEARLNITNSATLPNSKFAHSVSFTVVIKINEMKCKYLP
ncbi:hypothetical protein F5Y05DRAFT_381380 [Hypoxylon sp. FL0543]|nr:hypothetical protein F5Y05DRAFT_381380 [Hypoxylon sp. FL0543]